MRGLDLHLAAACFVFVLHTAIVGAVFTIRSECERDVDCGADSCCLEVLSGVGECHRRGAEAASCLQTSPFAVYPAERPHRGLCPCASGLYCGTASRCARLTPQAQQSAIARYFTYIFLICPRFFMEYEAGVVLTPERLAVMDYCVRLIPKRRGTK